MHSKRPNNVTLYGACSTDIKHYVFMTAKNTSIEETTRFLKLLRTEIDIKDGRRETYVVLDGHPAHRSPKLLTYVIED